jgi:ABC transporter, ATP-binding protein
MNDMAYIEMKHSYKRYQVGDTEIVANRDVNFEIEKGELVIILGASGAWKINRSQSPRRYGYQ